MASANEGEYDFDRSSQIAKLTAWELDCLQFPVEKTILVSTAHCPGHSSFIFKF